MPVSALVLTLDPGEREKRGVKYVLSRDPRVTLGDLVDDCLPVVTTTDSLEEAEDLAEQLLGIPGVRFLDVVSVDFSDVEEIASGSAGRSPRRARRAHQQNPAKEGQ
ncbi:MAG: hypothetical protein IPI67_34285 [Myxococcales bacterium]|nr:hypothetical protein [Myxococcales bacterium]